MATAQERNGEIDGDYKSFQLQGSIYVVPQCGQICRSRDLKIKGYDETWYVIAKSTCNQGGGFMVLLERPCADPKLGKVSVDVEMELFGYDDYSDDDYHDARHADGERQSFKKIPKIENLVYEACSRPTSMVIYSVTCAEWITMTILSGVQHLGDNTQQGFDIDLKIQVTPQCYGLALKGKVVQDWNTLFDDQTYGDVSICVGEKEFKVDRGILSVRSPVFAAMFSSDMAEKKNNTVNIDDIEVEVVGEMLRYLYTGTTPEIEKFAGGLLVAAEKYQIEDLKYECSKYLAANITVENAVEILVLAHLNNYPPLKKKVLGFIKANGKAVKQSVGWKNSMPKHADLLMELFDIIL